MAALTAALMGLSALSSYAATRQQGEYESSQFDVNAGLADRQAADALARGRDAASQQAAGTRQLIGAQRVALAGQGVALDSGTAADLQAESAELGEMDRLAILNNARRQAHGFEVDAANSRARGEQVRQSSRATARGTLLTAGTQLYAMGREAGYFTRKPSGPRVPAAPRAADTHKPLPPGQAYG